MNGKDNRLTQYLTLRKHYQISCSFVLAKVHVKGPGIKLTSFEVRLH